MSTVPTFATFALRLRAIQPPFYPNRHYQRLDMDIENKSITPHISFRGNIHDISLSITSPRLQLHELLEDLTTVPVSGQKLVYKGKKSTGASSDADVSLKQADLKDE